MTPFLKYAWKTLTRDQGALYLASFRRTATATDSNRSGQLTLTHARLEWLLHKGSIPKAKRAEIFHDLETTGHSKVENGPWKGGATITRIVDASIMKEAGRLKRQALKQARKA